MTRQLIVLLGTISVACGPSLSSVAAAETPAERITRLIEALASPNKPFSGEPPMIRMPPDYDKQAQAKVFAAYEALLAEGEVAFPQLTEHLQDERYCATLASASTESNVDVGCMCGLIIRAHLGAYLEQLPRGLGSWNPEFLVVESSKFRDWLRKNKDRKLWELQVTAINAAIPQILEAEPRLLIDNYHADSRLVAQALGQSQKRLTELRKQIQASKEPLKPKGPFVPTRRSLDLKMRGLPAK